MRPRKRARNVIFDPACSGGLVSQVTDVMFWYQAGAFEGSAAKAATMLAAG